MPDALQLSEVRAGYGETIVLEDVSFTLPERGSLAILGRNGVGKTTLLATIMGHTTFHSGKILFNDREVNSTPIYERARAGIGYVPQDRLIFPSLSVEENLTVAARPGRWTLERVHDLFPRLAERKHHRGNQISGGEQQMLAIGRALMTNPKLLILDEATEGLAPLIRQEIWERLAALKAEGLSILIIDKNVKALLRLSDRHLILEKGRIVWSGTSRALAADPVTRDRYLSV